MQTIWSAIVSTLMTLCVLTLIGVYASVHPAECLDIAWRVRSFVLKNFAPDEYAQEQSRINSVTDAVNGLRPRYSPPLPSSDDQITCGDLRGVEGNTKKEALMRCLGESSGYYNRYEDEIFSQICDGDLASINYNYMTIDRVKQVMDILGVKGDPAADKRTEKDKLYPIIESKFSSMGLCSACASNVAAFYIYDPSSNCGKIAAMALDYGDKDALATLMNGTCDKYQPQAKTN